MSDLDAAVKALREAKAEPGMDSFTYLTLIESHLSPELLPTLDEILQDAKLAQEVGWDLIDKLIRYPGSDKCLETIARLGNPREAMLKVLEILERNDVAGDDGDAEKDGEPEIDSTFITLLGMLAILHRRIKTKYPSRFLVTSLTTVAQAYRPTPGRTAAVINLVQSLSGTVRPPLPMRRSSTYVRNPDREGDSSKNAPDPEAETEDSTEREIQDRLLLCFITCILETYVQANDMEWSARLWEHYNPKKRIPGAQGRLDAFKEEEELQARDAMMGQLVAFIRDLGLFAFSHELIKALCEGPMIENPLELINIDDMTPATIPLSTGGTICLLAYVVFSSTVFSADHPLPELCIFPHHFYLMEGYMGDDFGKRANTTPGTVDALVAIALWLKNENKVGAMGDRSPYMEYLHFLGLTAVFHPHILVRNATTGLAGSILHHNPDDEDRLRVLEDLIENCTFDALKASAITWLREEIIETNTHNIPTVFMSSECIDQLQYHVFPDMGLMVEREPQANWPNWQASRLFYHQVANFAYFLFKGGQYKHLVPKGMGAAVEQRFVDPLLQGCEKLLEALKSKKVGVEEGAGPEEEMDLMILVDVLKSVSKLLDGTDKETAEKEAKE